MKTNSSIKLALEKMRYKKSYGSKKMEIYSPPVTAKVPLRISVWSEQGKISVTDFAGKRHTIDCENLPPMAIMDRLRTKLLTLAVLILLAGCSGMNGRYNCNGEFACNESWRRKNLEYLDAMRGDRPRTPVIIYQRGGDRGWRW